MNAQNVDESFLQLDNYLSEEAWEEHVSVKLAGKVIGIGKVELRNLRTRADDDLTSNEKMKMLALEEAVGPYMVSSMTDLDPVEASILRTEAVGRAKMAYLVIGSEQMKLRWLVKRARQFRLERKSKDRDSLSLRTPLNEATFRKAIGLTAEQEKDVELLLKESEKRLLTDGVEKTSLTTCLQKHSNLILNALARDKKQLMQKRIGQPILWFQCNSKQRFLDRRFSQGSYRKFTREHGGKRLEDGRFIADLDPKELAELGIQFMHGHVHEMLRSPFIWEELECTSSQREKLSKGISILASSEHIGQRLVAIVDGEFNYPDALEDFLLEHQVERLQCLEYQVLTNQFRFSYGLLHPAVSEVLELGTEQIESIKELEKGFRIEYGKLEEALLKHRNGIRLDLKKELLKILTREQIELLEQLES